MLKRISNILVGRAKGHHSWSAHTPGVREGNRRGGLLREVGLITRGQGKLRAEATARRSTGIQPKPKNPIDPRMPVLTPA